MTTDMRTATVEASEQRLSLMSEWARLGVLFNTAPATYRIDLEDLIVRTAGFARMDERLFVMAASWLAEHHQLLDARRLGRKLDSQLGTVSAVVGAVLTLALEGAPSATQLRAAVKHCEPLTGKQPLYVMLLAYPRVLELVKQEALPLYEKWGFWHNDAVLKLNAVRPISWIWHKCPEMRLRALVGTGLEAEILELVYDSAYTVTQLARRTEATYAAVHEAASRLIKRGLARRETATPKLLRPHPLFIEMVDDVGQLRPPSRGQAAQSA